MTVVQESPASLLAQVSCLSRLEPELLERLRHEVLTVPTGWVAAYGDYQSGGWWTLSLLNHTGNPADVTIRDCQPVATSLLDRMPVAKELLDRLGLRYMWVRLARLRANSFLWEHRDYGELQEAERHRLHIPVLTNTSAFLATGGAKVRLRAGRIWRLTPTYPHGVCNLLGPDRIHLILDCYADQTLAELTGSGQLTDTDVTMLPGACSTELDEQVETARSLALLGYTRAAERQLLRLFYRYALTEGCVYDLIVRLYDELGRSTAAESWRAKRNLMLDLP